MPKQMVHHQSTAVLKIVKLLEKIVLWDSPHLQKIFTTHGKKTIYSYLSYLRNVKRSATTNPRKNQLIAVVRELISRRLGRTVGRQVARQLKRYPVVSTTEHHAIASHPLILNTGIINALSAPLENSRQPQYTISFSFSSVSLNNSSAYPRGLIFHGDGHSSKKIIRLPLLPDKEKMSVVFGARPFNRNDIQRAKKLLDTTIAANHVSREKGTAIHDILDTLVDQAAIMKTDSFATQISKLNYHLWPKYFHPAIPEKNKTKTTPPGSSNATHLIYLEIETLVAELLIRHHLTDRHSLIRRLLIDPDVRAEYMRHFNNIRGAFSRHEGWGTHLFWAVNDKQRRLAMHVKNNAFVSVDEAYRLMATPAALSAALKTKKIFPSMSLCYIVIALHYGIVCLGGLSQVSDLNATAQAWKKLLHRIGEINEIPALKTLSLNIFGADGVTLAYLATAPGEISPATGIDMIISKKDTSLLALLNISKKVTMLEAIRPMLPEIYRCLRQRPSYQKIADKVTPEITAELIARVTGLAKQMK